MNDINWLEMNQLALTAQLGELLAEHQIPRHVWNGIAYYVFTGRPTGGFLTAVFSGDPAQGLARADRDNAEAVTAGRYSALLLALPPGCHGSPENQARWRAHGGLSGLTP